VVGWTHGEPLITGAVAKTGNSPCANTHRQASSRPLLEAGCKASDRRCLLPNIHKLGKLQVLYNLPNKASFSISTYPACKVN
jgi:hypothetical protein